MSKIKLEDLKYIGKEPAQDAEVNEPIDEIVEEEVVEESTAEEDIEEEAAEEEVVEETEEVVEKTSEAEPVVESITLAVVDKAPSAIQNVKNIKIYSRPSVLIPARSFTGNVEVLGHIEDFTIVKYVKAGFGSVKGYTKDI